MKSSSIVRFALLCLLVSAPLLAAEASSSTPEQKAEELSLSPLRKECRLECKWIGAVYQIPWGTWLTCGDGEPVLVTTPLNLLGKVHLASPEDALSFVQFFSSPDHYEMFDLDGMVEVTTSEDFWGFNLVEEAGVADRFHSPSVRGRSVEGFCNDKHGVFHECTHAEYTINRFVVLYDNNLYETQETVTEDGFYVLCSKTLVVRDLSRFGILHMPPH